jgi:general stress protein 26
MGHTRRTDEEPEKQLWEQLDHVRAGMLGIEGSHAHMQPMAHLADKDGDAQLWFFASRSSDLYKQLGEGARAHFCTVGKGQDYHACLTGRLVENRERGRIEQYWSDGVAAWFDDQSDPDLALLEFDLLDAAIWASTRNPIKLAWELRRARDSSREPDIGARAHLNFAPPAEPTRRDGGVKPS